MTIQEALNLHEEAKKNYEFKRFEMLNEMKLNTINKLDEWLKLNIYEVLKAPQYIFWKVGWPPSEIHKDIESNYPDFTIKFVLMDETVRIKLADKDWDWDGYGIKPIEILEHKPKPNLFKRIFSKFK